MPEEDVAVRDMLQRMKEGGKGIVPDKKSNGVVRLYEQKINSLSIYDDQMDRVGVVMFRWLASYTLDIGEYETGLGRWLWLLVGSGR